MKGLRVSHTSQLSRTLLLLSVILAFTASAAALGVELDEGDQNIWVQSSDDELNGEINGCSSSDLNITLEAPNGNSPWIENSETFSKTFGTDTVGGFDEYKLKARCGGNNSEATFRVKKLTADLKKPQPGSEIEVYQGDDREIEVEAKIEGAKGQPLRETKPFKIKFLGSDTVEVTDYERTDVNPYKLSMSVPSDIEPGQKSMRVIAEYENAEGDLIAVDSMGNNEDLFIDVKKPWKFDVSNMTPSSVPIDYTDSGKISMKLEAKRKGKPESGLTSSDFYLTITDEKGDVFNNLEEKSWVNSEPLSQVNGRYKLSLQNIPEITSLPVGEYRFKIGMHKAENEIVKSIPVNNYMTLSGKGDRGIVDATGKPVNAKIEARRDGIVNSFNVNNGNYEGKVLPGLYNFSAVFPGANIFYRGVNLNPQVQGAIRYDEIPVSDLSQSFDGVDVISAAGITFGYPFKSARIQLNYNPSRVGFSNVRVLECQRWNLQARNCRTSWDSINTSEVTVYPTTGRAVFEATPVNISEGRNKMLSSYALVKDTNLQSEYLRFKTGRVPIGGSIPVEGKVVTPEGRGVGGVSVNVSVIRNGNVVKTSQMTTQDSGIYGSNIKAPGETGVYSLRVDAQKKPYKGFRTESDDTFDTYVERGIEVNLPDQVKFNPGETSTARFRIINTGQAPLNDVRIYIKNLKNSWYEFQQRSWDTIREGGDREAVLEVEIPDDYCGTPCQEYQEFNVEAKATSGNEEVNSIKNIQGTITRELNNTQEVSSSKADGGDSIDVGAPLNVTGQFLASRSALNIGLGLITLFLMVLAVSVKKQKNSDSSPNRNLAGSGSGVKGSKSGRENSGSRVEKPQVSNAEPDIIRNDSGSEDSEEEADDEESSTEDVKAEGEKVCDECGEEFDTKAALELHREMNDLD